MVILRCAKTSHARPPTKGKRGNHPLLLARRYGESRSGKRKEPRRKNQTRGDINRVGMRHDDYATIGKKILKTRSRPARITPELEAGPRLPLGRRRTGSRRHPKSGWALRRGAIKRRKPVRWGDKLRSLRSNHFNTPIYSWREETRYTSYRTS